jgi:tetratricopeptide (TPR) repeat protein
MKGQYDKAINCYLQATRLEPQMADYWYYLGSIFFNTGKFIEAEQAWLKVVQIAPNHPGANQGLFSIREEKKKNR